MDTITTGIEIGDAFGAWTVLSRGRSHGRGKHRQYFCRCRCGTERWVKSKYLREGSSRSCGCTRPGVTAAKNPRWKGEAAYQNSIHQWLNRRFPKRGTCDLCGKTPGVSGPAGTHYAYLHHPDPYSRDRADYIELCPRCHKRFDSARKRAKDAARH